MDIMSLQSIIFLIFLLFCCPSLARSEEPRESSDYSITCYGAVMTDGALPETAFLSASFDRDFKFAAVAAAKKIGNLFDRIDFELEGQIVKHLVGQHHWEFNILVVARWLRFPWNNLIKTSFAIGEGLSLALETPAFEEKYHGTETNAFLNYLMFEFDFSLPSHPRWSLVTRLHHRSGIYGLFNGVDGASNALGLGIRYHF
jgi:hypothetical protein